MLDTLHGLDLYPNYDHDIVFKGKFWISHIYISGMGGSRWYEILGHKLITRGLQLSKLVELFLIQLEFGFGILAKGQTHMTNQKGHNMTIFMGDYLIMIIHNYKFMLTRY